MTSSSTQTFKISKDSSLFISQPPSNQPATPVLVHHINPISTSRKEATQKPPTQVSSLAESTNMIKILSTNTLNKDFNNTTHQHFNLKTNQADVRRPTKPTTVCRLPDCPIPATISQPCFRYWKPWIQSPHPQLLCLCLYSVSVKSAQPSHCR